VTSVSGNALVTGATGGIGQAIARTLAARDVAVTVTGRRVDVLETLASEISGRAIACDLSHRDDVDRLVQEAGHVDLLVANAALPGAAELTDLTQEQIDGMLEVNLRAPIALARALVPPMVSRRRGHLVFISSLNSKAATPATSVYAAAKFGLRGFALCLREDLRAHGVGVSSVLPGFIRDAGMFAETNVDLPRGVGTRSPEDVAAAVVKAIEQNRAEVGVAPLGLRLGATFAGVAPDLAAAAARRLGSAQVAIDMAEAQRGRH
jgi:short-subunit dehydrogenase